MSLIQAYILAMDYAELNKACIIINMRNIFQRYEFVLKI